jgi:hypothetical protein
LCGGWIVFDDGTEETFGAFIHGYESLWLPATLLDPTPIEDWSADGFTRVRRG